MDVRGEPGAGDEATRTEGPVIPAETRQRDIWPILLVYGYLALIPVLMELENVRGVTILLAASAAGCLAVWLARRVRPPSHRLLAPLAWGVDGLRRLPLAVMWLPLPVCLSWVAGWMARVYPADADYYLAFGVWLVAIIAFLGIFLVPLVAAGPRSLPALASFIRWPVVATVGFITLAAFLVRFINLADAPGPFGHDEGLFANLGLQVAQGIRQGFLFPGSGTFPSDTYELTIGLPFKLFGPSIFWARFPHVIVGAATIPLMYLMLREMFDRRVALVGAVILAVYHFHIHFSRITFPNLYDTFFLVLGLLFAFRAIRTGKHIDFALAGLAAGLQFYFFSGARLLPVVLVILLVYMALKTRGKFVTQNFWGLGVIAAGFTVASLPAALFWDGNPGTFQGRWVSENIFDSGWLDREVALTGHSELHVLWDQFQQSLGVLVAYAEESRFYNAQVPLLSGISSVFFVIGGVYALLHINQPRFLALLALLLLAVMFGGTLLKDPPQAQRYLTTVPVTVTFVAMGVVIAADALVSVLPRLRSYAPALVVALVLVIAFVDLNFYFGTYLPLHNNDDPRDMHAQAAEHLEMFDNNYTVYIFAGPGFSARQHALEFRSRDKILVDVSPVGVMGETDVETVPLVGEAAAAARRSRPNAIFVVPTDRATEFLRIRENCPGGVKSGVNLDPYPGFELVFYDVVGAQTCVDRLQQVGILKEAG